jgi:hypothetical protein
MAWRWRANRSPIQFSYKIENIGLVKITGEDEHLYIQMSNQPKFEILPGTQTEFFPKIVQAEITCACQGGIGPPRGG